MNLHLVSTMDEVLKIALARTAAGAHARGTGGAGRSGRGRHANALTNFRIAQIDEMAFRRPAATHSPNL